MADLPIPNKVKKLWDVWQLRGCIMLSLFLQAFLVLFASSRRKSKSSFLVFFIWSAYLLADWVAAVAIGLITQSQTDLCESNGNKDDLFAFWASFLLLHLGGPDSITSFALEDNEFWLRHLFSLILQVLGASYSIYLTLPNNGLWLPTLLVFVVGVIKYAERTCALYLASSDHFGSTSLPKPNPGHEFEAAVAEIADVEYSSTVQVSTVEVAENISGGQDEIFQGITSSDEIKLLQVAYELHDSFKGLIVGFGLGLQSQESSRMAFLKANHTSAFKVIGYELSILYEVIHTKVVVVRRKLGYIFRFLGFCFVIVAFVFFALFAEIHGFEKFDIGLTYALLIGAIVLDSISVVRDQIMSSDWTLGALKEKWSKYIPSALLKRRRWSETVLQHNIISYCLEERRMYSWLYNSLNALGVLDNIKTFDLFYHSEKVSEELKASIFNDMKTVSETMFSRSREIYMQDHRGDNLRRYYINRGLESEMMRKIDRYSSLIGEEAYLPKLLTYHLATEIYCTCSFDHNDQEVKRVLKILSRYLFYLMATQPTVLSPNLGDWEEKFKETVVEIKKFFDKHDKISNDSEACEKIKESLSTLAIRPSTYHHGGEQETNQENKKSLFSDACILASKLLSGEEGLEHLRKQMMALLFKGAMSCEPMIHAQHLSKGGELLTFVWLLSKHLGLGEKELKDWLRDTQTTAAGRGAQTLAPNQSSLLSSSSTSTSNEEDSDEMDEEVVEELE
ncbi:hypothetical protein TorRG33x02_125430 [Trema orientale]|uniref:DUF4220 domain-containing protein n=1 Tax=Trema orientale TaxID=63057 RepID=A0A2P5F1P7_TREOI|nr:hypothetical protein TorRG33x02_125430 [Trema orientale]